MLRLRGVCMLLQGVFTERDGTINDGAFHSFIHPYLFCSLSYMFVADGRDAELFRGSGAEMTCEISCWLTVYHIILSRTCPTS
jgi:hypothetical protein